MDLGQAREDRYSRDDRGDEQGCSDQGSPGFRRRGLWRERRSSGGKFAHGYLVAKVGELQRNRQICFFQPGDGALEVVALLTRYADLVALDGRTDTL